MYIIRIGNSQSSSNQEKPLLRVPHETMRQNFKQLQKNVEREIQELKSSLDGLETKSDAEESANRIEELKQRMGGLKKKLMVLRKEQDSHLNRTKARITYLHDLFKISEYDSYSFEQWSIKRLDILLVDYFLRSGFTDTAMQYAETKNIRDLVEIDVLLECTKIEKSLRRRETADCLAWCQENKTHLKKIRSTLDFEIRLQQYIELARQRKQSEAIQYLRKYMVKNVDTHLDIIQQASALLAFDPDTEVETYQTLYSPKRWDDLADMFVNAYFELHGLLKQSPLVESLATGISSLKTYSCGRHNKQDLSRGYMCPVCSEELYDLSEPLPYALHVRSHLDSDPVVLPNGRIYGLQKLQEYSRKAGVQEDKVADPISREIFDADELKSVFPS
jgi:macrophage erythroblast attacher